MLHTPIPHRVAPRDDEQRLPPTAGILIATATSLVLWGAIYMGYVLTF
jgi:hypothetical protein